MMPTEALYFHLTSGLDERDLSVMFSSREKPRKAERKKPRGIQKERKKKALIPDPTKGGPSQFSLGIRGG